VVLTPRQAFFFYSVVNRPYKSRGLGGTGNETGGRQECFTYYSHRGATEHFSNRTKGVHMQQHWGTASPEAAFPEPPTEPARGKNAPAASHRGDSPIWERNCPPTGRKPFNLRRTAIDAVKFHFLLWGVVYKRGSGNL